MNTVESKIYNVFYVFLLKKFHGTLPLTTVIPPDNQDRSNGSYFKPTTIIDHNLSTTFRLSFNIFYSGKARGVMGHIMGRSHFLSWTRDGNGSVLGRV